VIGCLGLITLKAPGQRVCRTANTLTSAIQNVRVNHGRTNVAVLVKFLNGSSVIILARKLSTIDARNWVFAFTGQSCDTT
jgi:hypothetical protein